MLLCSYFLCYDSYRQQILEELGGFAMISEKNIMKLQNGSDVRGVAVEGVADEPVNLYPEAANRIAAGFVDFLSGQTGKKAKDLRIAVGHD